MGRIFLLVGHAGLADTLALFLSEQSRGALTVVGRAAVTLAGLSTLVEAAPDAVLLSVGLDAIQELHVAAAVRALCPGSIIVVIDTMGEAARATKAYPQPIDALIAPDQIPERLVATLRRLIAPVA